MTAILSALGAWFVGVLSKDVLAFFWNALANWWATYQAQQAVEAVAQKDEEQLAAAKTEADKIAAAKQINQDTFGGSGTSP